MEQGDKEFANKMAEVQDLSRWRDGVNKALWILFTVLTGVVIKLLSEVIKIGG